MSELRFPETVLAPYSEPVAASQLRQGEIYFSLNFIDEEMLIPVLQPVTYVGSNLREGDVDVVYLQDLESYREGVRLEDEAGDSGTANAVFVSGRASEMHHIFEFEKALDVLLACALRHRAASTA